MADVTIRPGVQSDLEAITGIYNHWVENGWATFDTEPVAVEDRVEWLSQFGETGPHRLLAAVEDDQVVGFIYSSPIRPKAAYSTSVETSVYLAPEATGRGIGGSLYRALFESLKGEDVHRAYAVIAEGNPAAVAAVEKLGYRHVGTLSEAGRKFGRYLDVAWYEKELS